MREWLGPQAGASALVGAHFLPYVSRRELFAAEPAHNWRRHHAGAVARPTAELRVRLVSLREHHGAALALPRLALRVFPSRFPSNQAHQSRPAATRQPGVGFLHCSGLLFWLRLAERTEPVGFRSVAPGFSCPRWGPSGVLGLASSARAPRSRLSLWQSQGLEEMRLQHV